ncbi:MAG: hypothetical protein IPJ08_20725 [Burkholderiales bacterium]|nr:hypothetical protein [Burkholderiales bacterium]
MVNEGAFPVEDFINAITTQLDRVQDALRVKAVNRPLTYALKDLQLELKVFVDLDPQGNVRFRPAGPNESGASTVNFGFTTITKPMIEENTVSMAATRSSPLTDLGLSPEEQQRLERMGVRNLAQLNNLRASTGMQTIARLTDVSMDRLRQAVDRGAPVVRGVTPAPQPPRPVPMPPMQNPPVVRPPVLHPPAQRPPFFEPPPLVTPPSTRPPVMTPPIFRPPGRIPLPVMRLEPGTRQIAVMGTNLAEGEQWPQVKLNSQPLALAEAEADRLLVELPHDHQGGTLEISLAGGETLAYVLALDDGADVASATQAEAPAAFDDWAPLGDRS